MEIRQTHPTPERVHHQLARERLLAPIYPAQPIRRDRPRHTAETIAQHANHCEGDQGNAEEQKERQHGENTDNQEQHRAAWPPG